MTRKREPHPIAAHIRTMRVEQRLSLTALACLCGVPAVVIGSYERGDRQPSLHQLERIYRALGADLAVVPAGFDVVGAVDELEQLRGFRDQVVADHWAAQQQRTLGVAA